MNMKNKRTFGTIIALIGGTCWGFSGCCGQYLFQQKGASAPWLVSLRLLFAGLLMIGVGFILNGKGNLRIFKKKKDVLHLLAFSLLGITFCQFTYFMAIEASNAGTATVLQYLSPVMILFIVCIREARFPSLVQLGAIGLSLLGTFVLGTHGDFHSLHITKEALVWGLLAAVSAVIYNMIPGKLIVKFDIYQVLGYGMLFGGILMSLIVRPWERAVIWDAGTWGALLGVIVVGTAIAFGLYLQGVSIIGPLKGSILASVEPVSAVIISVFWLGTAFTAADFAGFALIVAAVFLLSFAQIFHS